jgi:hypothetical protein
MLDHLEVQTRRLVEFVCQAADSSKKLGGQDG